MKSSRTNIVFLVVAAAILPFAVSEYRVFQLTMMLVFAIALVGLNLLTGYSGQISLGHGAFYALGAYIAAISIHRYGVPYWWTLPMAALAGLIVGYLFGRPALRLQGLYLALATFALAIATPPILRARQLEPWTGGIQGIVISKPSPPFGWMIGPDRWLYLVVLAIAVALFAAAANLMRGRIGRALIGIRDNPIAAVAMGIDTASYKSIAFGVSAMYTAVAGALGAIVVQFVAPDSFTLFLSTSMLVGIVVGGLGSISGAIYGALFIEFAPIAADRLFKGAPGVIYGLLLILAVLAAPKGMAGLFARIGPMVNDRMKRFVPAAVAALTLLVAMSSVRGGKLYSPGVSDTEIRIGQTMSYSGPLSIYGPLGTSEAAYFVMVNDEGGVNGRRIKFISLDDGYSPTQTVEQTRRLIEQEDVLLTFSSLGTQTQTAVHEYMNIKGVPQLFPSSGASKWNDPLRHPWTMGPVMMPYNVEGRLYAAYLLTTHPNAKIAILFPNDDAGRDYLKGFHEGLGIDKQRMIVAERAYASTSPGIDSEIIALQASGADTLFDASNGKFTSLAIKKAYDIGWAPLHIITGSGGGSIAAVLKPAGLDKSKGVIMGMISKTTQDPSWNNDLAMKEYLAWMKKYNPSGDVNDSGNVTGYNRSVLLVHLLKQCGHDLSRENVMHQVANLKNVELPLLLPGIRVNTSPTDFAPIEQMQLARFDGASWVRFGDVLGK